MGQHRGEDGVSEVIAAVLLVGITVLAVTVISVILLSGPHPDEIPHAAIVAGNEGGKFALVHEGGDPLRVGEYRIYIKTKTGSGLEDRTDNFTRPAGGVWLVGENITYRGTGTPERVVVTAISGESEIIVTEVALGREGKVFDPDPVEPEVPEEPEEEEEEEFIDFVINKSVFVYGTKLGFTGDNIYGPEATIVITGMGGLNAADLKTLGASIAVSDIYINGSVNLGEGSSSLGSPDNHGHIYINGDLTLNTGNRSIYGDVYVNGNCDLDGAWIYGNMFVNGSLTLRREDTGLMDGAYIYYTGAFAEFNNVNSSTIAKCIHQTTVPGFTMPDLEIPPTKLAGWYTERGYAPNGALTNNLKIFAPSYTSSSGSATNVIIIASDGDISITSGWSGPVTGVFFAPRGKVTFNGGTFEGTVIARDGFFATYYGSTVTFKKITDYIDNPEHYPF